MNILLVEDAELVRLTAIDWLEIALEHQNCEAKVFAAHDDKTAIEILRSIKVDVVLLDMVLKSGAGGIVDIEFLIAEIRRINSDTRIIAMSGAVEDQIVRNCAKNNLLEVLMEKPVNYDKIVRTIIEGKR